MKIISISLIIWGLFLTIFTSISLIKGEENLKPETVVLPYNQPQHFSRSPLTGLATIVFGVFLIVKARKKE